MLEGCLKGRMDPQRLTCILCLQDIQIDALLIRACEPVIQAHCHVSTHTHTHTQPIYNVIACIYDVEVKW